MQKSNGYNMMRYTAFSSRCPVCVEPTNPPVQHHRAKSECGANHHLASKGVPLNVNPREACGSVGDTPLQLKLSRPNLGINGYLDRIADYTDRHTVLGQSARTGRRYWL